MSQTQVTDPYFFVEDLTLNKVWVFFFSVNLSCFLVILQTQNHPITVHGKRVRERDAPSVYP